MEEEIRETTPFKKSVITPLAMGKETPPWWCSSSITQGQSRRWSFDHSNMIPGLVDKAVLCLELMKIKSNQSWSAKCWWSKTDRKSVICKSSEQHKRADPVFLWGTQVSQPQGLVLALPLLYHEGMWVQGDASPSLSLTKQVQRVDPTAM